MTHKDNQCKVRRSQPILAVIVLVDKTNAIARNHRHEWTREMSVSCPPTLTQPASRQRDPFSLTRDWKPETGHPCVSENTMAHRAELLNDPRRRTRHLPREVRDWKISITKCQKHTSLAEKGQKSKLNSAAPAIMATLSGPIISRQGPPNDHGKRTINLWNSVSQLGLTHYRSQEIAIG